MIFACPLFAGFWASDRSPSCRGMPWAQALLLRRPAKEVSSSCPVPHGLIAVGGRRSGALFCSTPLFRGVPVLHGLAFLPGPFHGTRFPGSCHRGPVPGGTRSPGPGRPVRAAPALARPAPRPPCERVRGPSGAVPGPCSPGPVAACARPSPAYDALPGRSLRPIARHVTAPRRGRARTGSRAVIHPRGTARFRRALTREPQESSGRLAGGESGRRGEGRRSALAVAGGNGGPYRRAVPGVCRRLSRSDWRGFGSGT
jgi:hypothetical protein